METIKKKTSTKTQVPMGRYVKNDLKKMKLTKWVEQVQDRRTWKDIVQKARTLKRVVAP